MYATRSEFISNMPAHRLFDQARSIRACGLSLNLLCQQYSEHSLRRLAEGGTSIQCLFLDPDGVAIRQREEEENYSPGTLSDLTRINIRSLQDRVLNLLPEEARSRLEIATYDETIRFNIILVDDEIGIVQPYLPALRGIDSPTFVLAPEVGVPRPIPHVRGHSVCVVDAGQDHLTDAAEFLPAAVAAMEIADAIIREGMPAVVTAKGDRDMVTDTDVEIERAVRGYLRQQYPQIGFMGEEEVTDAGPARPAVGPRPRRRHGELHQGHPAVRDLARAGQR